MCKYCDKRANNKEINDIDNDKSDFMQVVKFKNEKAMLYIELEGEDDDGYKPCDFFKINYCPMCGKELEVE